MNPILVIADDKRHRRLTTTALRHGGFEVRVVTNAEKGGRVVQHRCIRGIVTVDTTAPASNVIGDLRTRTVVPIVVVCEHADAAARVACLDAGADDYIAYPFDVEEFLARLRATFRRFDRSTDDELPLITEDFIVHLSDRQFLLADGTDAHLSPTEWRLVEVLLRRPGHLVGHEEILRAVWGPAALSKPGLLRVHLASIRRKVEPDPTNPRYFLTVPGLGLRFEPSKPIVGRAAT